VGLYVHYAGDDVLEVAKDAHRRFFSENALGGKAFPSLQKFEQEIVGWTLDILNGGPAATGTVTSGGTESIFLAMKAAREWARATRPVQGMPEIVAPVSAHPAFDKAAHYLGMRVIRVPLRHDFRADPDALRKAVTADTIALVGSAPAFPHGVIDPIPELGILAVERQLWFHVDACVGGFLAPFVRKIGYAVPPFDFAVESVHSISADLHKYGFTGKGASTLLLREAELKRYQVFEFSNWPRGTYTSPTFTGTRPGGPIAAAWAVMRYLGEEGYLRIARIIMTTRDGLARGIEAIPDLKVWGKPDLSIMCYGSTAIDMFAVADRLRADGWYVTPMADPPGIHLGMLTPAHAPVVSEYLASLGAAVDEVRRGHKTEASREVSYGS
jgi:glutamate/tyrosine decarboxylase-like PLP-dependent enzyme